MSKSSDKSEIENEVLSMPLGQVQSELRRNQVCYHSALDSVLSHSSIALVEGSGPEGTIHTLKLINQKRLRMKRNIKIAGLIATLGFVALAFLVWSTAGDYIQSVLETRTIGVLFVLTSVLIITAVLALASLSMRILEWDEPRKILATFSDDVSRIEDDLLDTEKLVQEHAQSAVVARQVPLKLIGLRLSSARLAERLNIVCGGRVNHN